MPVPSVRCAGHAKAPLHGGQVLGAPHERDRQQVDALRNCEVDPGQILLAGRGERDVGAREVQALVRGHPPTDQSAAAPTATVALSSRGRCTSRPGWVQGGDHRAGPVDTARGRGNNSPP